MGEHLKEDELRSTSYGQPSKKIKKMVGMYRSAKKLRLTIVLEKLIKLKSLKNEPEIDKRGSEYRTFE